MDTNKILQALAKVKNKKEEATATPIREEYMFALPTDFRNGSIARKEAKPMSDMIANIMTTKPRIDLSKVQEELDNKYEEGIDKLDSPFPETPEDIVGLV